MKTFDHLSVIGLREWVALPDLGISQMIAKVDSGAKTSALHASNISTFERDGQDWVRFDAHVGSRSKQKTRTCEARLIDLKRIKSSNGQLQERFVIRTPLVLGDRTWLVDFTLTCRKAMRYRMLLGCTAMQDAQLVINPGLRFVQDKPQTDTLG
ncbi:MAG: ATP-dependent zinc protease [Pseudomonadales bacterium]|nr:ATP-dependent zinc protease [Pseudomonadales bacterium]HIQ52629.1 ATP-dependent zinc protease [Halopseudomonas pachastrellae]